MDLIRHEEKHQDLVASFKKLCECQAPLLALVEKVCETHFLYMEIFRRLSNVPNIEMRTIRKYLIDYYAMIRFAMSEVQVLRSGRLFRVYDFVNNPVEFVHPTLTSSFQTLTRRENDTCRLSNRSIYGCDYLMEELMETLSELHLTPCHPHTKRCSDTVEDITVGLTSMLLRYRNWEMDLLDMFDNVQQILRTKICMGYDKSQNKTDYFYDLKLTPDNWSVYRRYPTLNIPMDKVQHNVRINSALTKFNILNLIIPDAFNCVVGVCVINDAHYRNEVAVRTAGHIERVGGRSIEEGESKILDRAAKSNKVWQGMFVCAAEKELSVMCDYWETGDDLRSK